MIPRRPEDVADDVHEPVVGEQVDDGGVRRLAHVLPAQMVPEDRVQVSRTMEEVHRERVGLVALDEQHQIAEVMGIDGDLHVVRAAVGLVAREVVREDVTRRRPRQQRARHVLKDVVDDE